MMPCTVDGAVVSVLLPVHNGGAWLDEALESILRQSFWAIEVIAIDDGSTDQSRSVLEAAAARDPRVRIVSRDNRGLVASLNEGLDLARGEFIARMDADDVSAPDRFERQLRHLRARPEVVAISGAHREIRADGTPTGRINRPPAPVALDPAWAPAREPQLTHPFLMVRRDALAAIGGYRSAFLSEDTDLYWRLAAIGRLENLEAVLGDYRMHAASVSSSILNGRVMALSSQLAALSARRRAAGLPDIAFPHGRMAEYRSARHLPEMFRLAAAGLDLAEVRWLAAATAGKLMELAGYRPYELEGQDCRFIGDTVQDLPRLPRGNEPELRKMRAATAARLIRLGRVADAMRLAPGRLWPQVLARVGTGRLYWKKHLA